jgi:aspartate carbamoyltransferase catalytic subunit
MRSKRTDSADVAAKVSKVPIINAGSGSGEHPTQALLDLFTIKEKCGRLDNLKICVSGDIRFSRTIHSLLDLFTHFDNIEFWGVSRPQFALSPVSLEEYKKLGLTYNEVESFDDLPRDIDVIYHTRTQKERFEGENIEIDELIINQEILDKFPKTILMHPLPRVMEIDPEVDGDERAVYFEQAHNGIPIRMALLYTLLKE